MSEEYIGMVAAEFEDYDSEDSFHGAALLWLHLKCEQPFVIHWFEVERDIRMRLWTASFRADREFTFTDMEQIEIGHYLFSPIKVPKISEILSMWNLQRK